MINKMIKSRIFFFMLGAIIFSSVTAFAVSTIIEDSSEIVFDNTNTSLQATNVEAALSELNGKLSSGTGLTRIARVSLVVSTTPSEYNYPKTATIDLKNYTSNYANLVLDQNLFPIVKSISINASYDYKPYSTTYNWTYNSSTGILTYTPSFSSNHYDIVTVEVYA